MDDDREVSQFIARWKARRKQAKTATEMSPKSLKLTNLIESQITTFWTQLLKRLELTVNALCEIDLSGSVSPFGEDLVRISVTDRLAPPIHSWTDLVRDGARIRCSVLDGGIYYLDFVAISDTELAIQDIQRNGDLMDVKTSAVYVIERMVSILDRALR